MDRRKKAEIDTVVNRLGNYYDEFYDELTADERDALSRVRAALERLIEQGERP